MEPGCEHRWRYFVDTATKAIVTRRCELCGIRAAMPLLAPESPPPVAA
jgi:hypothetical protein